MHDRRIPIDADAFVVHKSEKYMDALGDIMRENNSGPGGRAARRGTGRGVNVYCVIIGNYKGNGRRKPSVFVWW